MFNFIKYKQISIVVQTNKYYLHIRKQYSKCSIFDSTEKILNTEKHSVCVNGFRDPIGDSFFAMASARLYEQSKDYSLL